MATVKFVSVRLLVLSLIVFYNAEANEKNSDDKIQVNGTSDKVTYKMSGSSVLLFADELKQTLEKYLFGICPQNYKVHWSQMGLNGKGKNSTLACDLDADQHDLAGRLAALALRAHTASRTECLRFGAVLANTLGELARTAATRQPFNAGSTNEPNKKRKLSKSQKMKIQAKQKTALAVKKKAAALAAAAAAKLTS